MHKSYKFRIYPDKEQRIFFEKNFGAVRFIYNKMLADKIEHYKMTKTMLKNTPAQYKKDNKWLKEVDSYALCNAQMNLDKAFKFFFKNIETGFPKFKNKKSNRRSYTTNNLNNLIKIENGKIRLPKLKSRVRVIDHCKINGHIKSCTIVATPSGKYFISVLTESLSANINNISTDKKIGIDLGLKDFAITSDGQIINNPKYFRSSEKKLAKLQKSFARKQIQSKNREESRVKVAKMYEKIANQQKDFLQKLSSKIINDNQVIVIEDLHVKNMMKNSLLAKVISEASWSNFRRMLEYKGKWYGREIIVAPTYYPSSQLCSICGHKNKDIKKLNVRQWTCPICNTDHNRDINAAKNLLKLANK
ncbi:IS200/IS605 family element transposase accessory protein TnpB [Paenibacillus tianjinensis]|uniref:IS200/IS605 family element transposase accessory protein TnpB n=1 Tax=Paenibacillus tianjinensis TaxID=2810347 RepID=A0ABX7LPX4_9BACL|nr:IS200/IS605 family element RNA-guided endonuclease TnpB [Paenibacillus tianjinensis]QSF47867.1 IS200/IS605 family element transposase accessory protein TnpB [Paenibacillus tianjinensis]